MAAEASRSSSAADSYLGSLISLTSNSEIRYEGVLFTINTEEASIGLRNVRSFGTEGRRKDGTQIPPSDRIYEYIVFRGSDIKDLQVKSSPPAASTTPSINNDPAIIQSHYTQAATSASLPTVNSTAGPDHSTQMPQAALPRSPFQSNMPYQNNMPMYQPGGTLPSWGLTAPIATNESGPVPPLQWQGYYGASSNLQNQSSYFQPPQGLPMPPGLSASQPSDFQPMLLQPQPNMHPGQPPLVASNTSTNVLPVVQNHSLPLVSPLSNAPEKDTVNTTMPSQAKFVSGPMSSYNLISEPLPADVGTPIAPSLVTPGQFLQAEPALISTSQPLQTIQKDVEVVQLSSTEPLSPSADVPISTESQPEEPLLPLPSHSNPQYNRAPSHNHYMHRGGPGGRGRGRRSELSISATSYTEDFDFEAMNEKFKKDEVWGHLGKGKANDDQNEDSFYGDNVDVQFPQVEVKPVYKKDDFFDTLSSNSSFDNGSRNGRPRFSEQTRFDTERYGNFPRYRGDQGGRGSGRGGYQRGGYCSRGGYGYDGRSQGHHNNGYEGRSQGHYNAYDERSQGHYTAYEGRSQGHQNSYDGRNQGHQNSYDGRNVYRAI